MRKIILYLDTSVISHIQAPHKPEAEAVTHAFFRFVQERREEYELAISPVVEQEVDNCPEPKRSKLKNFLLDLGFRQKVISRFHDTGVPVKWAFGENQNGTKLISESLRLCSPAR